MATLGTTTAKTDNIDGSVKEAYRHAKPAGIVHCPSCSGSGSIHTAVCVVCEGDGHVESLSVDETNKAEKEAARKRHEESLKKDEETDSFESVREMSAENAATFLPEEPKAEPVKVKKTKK